MGGGKGRKLGKKGWVTVLTIAFGVFPERSGGLRDMYIRAHTRAM